MTRIWVEKIARDTYVLRIDDTRTKYFESLWSIPEGITYNAYLTLLPDHVILFDGWKSWYAEDLVETLREVVEPKSIDYVVVHHMEPDHTGSLPNILAEARNAVVLGHPLASKMIRSFYGLEPRFQAARDGAELRLGERTLVFIHTPWLHWPETMMTYLMDDRVLFTGDAFGGYSMPPMLFDDDEAVVRSYLAYARKYLATVIGHYRQHVVKAVEKLRSLNVEPSIVAPAHGLIWRRNPELIVEKYLSWARAEASPGKIVVVYGSTYGATESMAKTVIRVLEAKGCRPLLYRFTDTSFSPLSDLLGDVLDSSALVVGSPTYEAGVLPTMRHAVEEIAWKTAAPKPVLLISSYGWGGAAAKKLFSLLSSQGFEVTGVVEVDGRPGDTDIERLAEEAEKLAEKACRG